jgi:hypothetical protein
MAHICDPLAAVFTYFQPLINEKKCWSFLILFQKDFVLHSHQASKCNTSTMKIMQEIPQKKHGKYMQHNKMSQPKGHNLNTH